MVDFLSIFSLIFLVQKNGFHIHIVFRALHFPYSLKNVIPYYSWKGSFKTLKLFFKNLCLKSAPSFATRSSDKIFRDFWIHLYSFTIAFRASSWADHLDSVQEYDFFLSALLKSSTYDTEDKLYSSCMKKKIHHCSTVFSSSGGSMNAQ